MNNPGPDRSNRTLFILCGGDSVRMKRDKAMLELGSSTYLEVLTGRASHYFKDIRLLAGGRGYKQIPLLSYRDEVPDAGPLSALLTACRVSPEHPFALHTVDAPLIAERLLDLLANFQPAGGFDVALFRDEKNLHPLSGIFHPRIAPALEHQLGKGRFAVIGFISSLNVYELSCKEEELINANRPEDHLRLKKIYETGLKE